MRPLDRRIWLAAATLAALPLIVSPVGDPDLWWHMSAGRWILEHRAWPRVDWLSATMAGRPWVDFEWLPQVIFYAAYSIAGMAGLWLIKAALLAIAGFVVWTVLRDLGVAPEGCALGLVLWASALLHRLEIRTELFSFCAFAILARELELRRQKLPKGPLMEHPWLFFVFFALWANCHAGFVYGLMLILAYGFAEADKRFFATVFGLSAAGILVNPYGVWAYYVPWRHAREIFDLSKNIVEWQHLRLDRFGHWPAWVLVGFVIFSFKRTLSRESMRELFPVTASAAFGVLAVLWARLIPYFATLSVPLTFKQCGAPNMPRRAYGAVFAAAAAFVIWADRAEGIFRGVSHDFFIPPRTMRYLARHAELHGRSLYNPWSWGGYFGFWLYPGYRVFQDGRYLFHPLLAEGMRVVRFADDWQSFLDRYRIDVAVLENTRKNVSMPRLYPDGSKKNFDRPFYILYMPRERWALVYWDDKALIFLRRSAFNPGELSRREYRLARPNDDQALEDALARREINVNLLAVERARHDRELEELKSGPDT